MKTAVSLFTGCGGSDAGLIQAGFQVLMANDILPYASEVYRANLPDTDYIVGNIEKFKKFPNADLLAGCYPCQGFSQGGVRKPDLSVNYLYREFARALNQISPKAFIVENVSGMMRRDFRHLLDDQVRLFSESGYRVHWKLLNAADFGVPQERRRIFIVGTRSDLNTEYSFPEPTHGPGCGQPHQTISDAISDMPLWPEGEYWTEPFHWYYLSRNRWRSWEEPSKTIVSHPRHMPLHPISPKLIRVHTDKWVWEVDGPRRRFSFREAARLQGFEKNHTMPDTVNSRTKYKVVGNAVPPPLFKAVAAAIPEIW